MAIEIANKVCAAGTFVPDPGDDPGQFSMHIPSSEGFLPFDPDTTTLAAKGGFTKVATGSYAMQLVDAIDPLESTLFSSILSSPGLRVAYSRVLPPGLPGLAAGGCFCAVTFTDQNGVETDLNIYQSVLLRYATGPEFLDVVNP